MKHRIAHQTAGGHRSERMLAATAAATVAATTLLIPSVSASAGNPAAPTVTHLSVRSGGTWGDDLVTIRGTGFGNSGTAKVSKVVFGTHKAYGTKILNATTIQAYSPEVHNKRAVVDVRVVWRSGKASRKSSVDRFTFVVPTTHTRLNGHWSAAQSQQIARTMMSKTSRLNNAPVAHNPGYWTPAMGRPAVHRAAGWLGLPYTWAGGSYTGPSYGSCHGDGLIGEFDCKIWGFDCSGLVLYSWSKYRHLAHYAATQRKQAGSFHPSADELQPGDLLFFSAGGSTISHVVMYAGNGKIIQASESGWPVRYSTIAQVKASHARYFGATRPMSKGKQGGSPSLTSAPVARTATTGGHTITLHGHHLDTTARVFFGSTPTYAFSIKSASTITVKVPAHRAGTVNVRVANAWGMSSVTSHARTTYVAPGHGG